jgi:hypothetical protein
LYGAMRALADGRTGEVRIGKRWLRGESIDAAAEMCRDIRMRCMRELEAAGLVSFERERVLRVVRGRRREVLGRTRYTVHRLPIGVVRAPAPVLLQSISSTVEEIDSQGLPKAPSPSTASGGVEGFAPFRGRRSKSSPVRAQSSRGPRRTTAPFLPRYENFKDQFRDVTPRQFDFAVERISHRAKTAPCSRLYWQTSLENFFANFAGETDAFLTDLVLLAGRGADLSEVVGRLKDEARDRDLHWNNDILDQAFAQARSRFERDAAVRSELQVGAAVHSNDGHRPSPLTDTKTTPRAQNLSAANPSAGRMMSCNWCGLRFSHEEFAEHVCPEEQKLGIDSRPRQRAAAAGPRR